MFGSAANIHGAGSARKIERALHVADVNAACAGLQPDVAGALLNRDVARSGARVHTQLDSLDSLVSRACDGGEPGLRRNDEVVVDADVVAQIVVLIMANHDEVPALVNGRIFFKLANLGFAAHRPRAARPDVRINGDLLDLAGVDGNSSRSGLQLEINLAVYLQVTVKTAFAPGTQVATGQQDEGGKEQERREFDVRLHGGSHPQEEFAATWYAWEVGKVPGECVNHKGHEGSTKEEESSFPQ